MSGTISLIETVVVRMNRTNPVPVMMALVFLTCGGCVTPQGHSSARVNMPDPRVTMGADICAIHKHASDYLGRQIILKAVYRTDRGSYAYLEDHSDRRRGCTYLNIMNAGFAVGSKDGSIKRFFADEKARCRKIESTGTGCLTMNSKMLFKAIVKSDARGTYLEIAHIYSHHNQWGQSHNQWGQSH